MGNFQTISEWTTKMSDFFLNQGEVKWTAFGQESKLAKRTSPNCSLDQWGGWGWVRVGLNWTNFYQVSDKTYNRQRIFCKWAGRVRRATQTTIGQLQDKTSFDKVTSNFWTRPWMGGGEAKLARGHQTGARHAGKTIPAKAADRQHQCHRLTKMGPGGDLGPKPGRPRAGWSSELYQLHLCLALTTAFTQDTISHLLPVKTHAHFQGCVSDEMLRNYS